MAKVTCEYCGCQWYPTLDPPCGCEEEIKLEAVITWAVMASELLKALGKGDTTTAVELGKALFAWENRYE